MCFDRPRRYYSQSVRQPAPSIMTTGVIQSVGNRPMVSIGSVITGGKKGCGCGGR